MFEATMMCTAPSALHLTGVQLTWRAELKSSCHTGCWHITAVAQFADLRSATCAPDVQ